MPNFPSALLPQSLIGTLTIERPAAVSTCRFRGDNRVGAYTYFAPNCAAHSTSVGRYCSIADHAMIGPVDHPTSWLTTHGFAFRKHVALFSDLSPEVQDIMANEPLQPNRPRTEIGHDVWIGYDVMIRAGVKIGNGTIIAAKAAVVADIEPFMIVGGVPARPIKPRFTDKIRERIERIQWWNYHLKHEALPNIRYADPEAALDIIEEAISTSAIKALTPETLNLKGDGEHITQY